MRTKRTLAICGRHGQRKRAILLPVLALLMVIGLNAAIQPLVDEAAAPQAERCAADTVSGAVEEWLRGHPQENLAAVTRSADGAIQSIETDAQKISALQAELNRRIQQKLAEADTVTLRIPLGTLLGGNLLRERGPRMRVRFAYSSSAVCKLETRVASAGINQTVHEVWLSTEVSMHTMIPGCFRKIDTTVSFCIAQTVIVGRVPSVAFHSK